MELIKPDLSANSFTSRSGIEYIVYDTVSTGRFPLLEICMVEVAQGISADGFRTETVDAYNSFNQMKFADGCSKLGNVINGTERIMNMKPHPLLKLASLFICSDDEDQDKWIEAEAMAKIDDGAGVDIAFFLRSVKRFLNVFFPGWNTDSLDTFDPESKMSGDGERLEG